MAQSTSTPSGRWVRQSSGYDAFVPDPLPPATLEVDRELAVLLSAADHALGRLDGVAGGVPDRDIFLFDVYQGTTLLTHLVAPDCNPAISVQVVPDPSLADTIKVVVGPTSDWAVCAYEWGPAAPGSKPGPFPTAYPPNCIPQYTKDYSPQG